LTSIAVRADSACLPLRHPAAVAAEVSEGAVVYLAENERYYALSAVAAQVWELLPPACDTFGSVYRALAARYPDVPLETLRRDVSDLLADLERLDLVRPADAA
jgi:hypothetical protein